MEDKTVFEFTRDCVEFKEKLVGFLKENSTINIGSILTELIELICEISLAYNDEKIEESKAFLSKMIEISLEKRKFNIDVTQD